VDNKYKCSGIYKLKCKSCSCIYIGQTGRQYLNNGLHNIHNIHKSKYANRSLHNGHECDNIDDVIYVLKITQEGPIMDVYGKFYAHKYEKDSGY
jgi:hypothetical protein